MSSRSVQSMVTLLLHLLDQLAGDGAERLVAENLHRAVVGLECVVEGQLVLRQTEALAPCAGLTHLPREPDQLLDHLRRLDGAILVAP